MPSGGTYSYDVRVNNGATTKHLAIEESGDIQLVGVCEHSTIASQEVKFESYIYWGILLLI